MKKRKSEKCVYCGKKRGDTVDHVISRNLFPTTYEYKNPVKVPSCGACNGGFSKDEEYFRFFLVNAACEHSPYAHSLLHDKIKRSLNRPQKLSTNIYGSKLYGAKVAKKIFSKMKLANLYTKSGLYLGKKTIIEHKEEDWDRYFNVLDKYVRGLIFHESKTILPKKYEIKKYFSNNNLEHGSQIKKWNLENKEIFVYGCNFVPNTLTSIWIFMFYDWIAFTCFVATKEEFDGFRAQKDLTL